MRSLMIENDNSDHSSQSKQEKLILSRHADSPSI